MVPVIEPSTFAVVFSLSFLLYPPETVIVSLIGHLPFARYSAKHFTCMIYFKLCKTICGRY